MLLDVRGKLSLRPSSILLDSGLDDSFEILQRELGIHRHQRATQLNHRVNLLAATKTILRREVLWRQDLR
jgi:hypothetical protein